MNKKWVLTFCLVTALCPMASAAGGAGAFVYDDHGRRDPFWKLVSPSGAMLHFDEDLLISDLDLEGIVVDPNGGNIAIINNKIVGLGDKIGLFEVLKITDVDVLLRKGQSEFVLQLKEE